MTQETPKLTTSEEFFNFCDTGAMPIVWLATVQWIVTSWIAQWRYATRRGRKFRLQWPHKLEVSIYGACRPQMIIENLRSFGISCQGISSQYVISGNSKALESSMLVAESQWEMADAILVQLGEGTYVVTSPAGSKRGAVFTRRWSVGAKARSFDEGLNGAIGQMFQSELKTPKAQAARRSARLGRTYS